MKIKRLLKSLRTARKLLRKWSPQLGIGVLISPLVLWTIGAGMNALVMAFNHGQMPVLWPGGCTPDDMDGYHVCMTAQTHLRVLADWIVTHGGVASPGDMFLFASDFIWYPAIAAWAAMMLERQRNARS